MTRLVLKKLGTMNSQFKDYPLNLMNSNIEAWKSLYNLVHYNITTKMDYLNTYIQARPVFKEVSFP